MNIDEFYGAYKLMLNKIQIEFPQRKIVLATPTYCRCDKDFPKTNGEINNLGYTINDYAIAVMEIARLYKIRVIPLFDELKWNANNCVLYIADEGEFLHPNKVGARQMGEVIGRELPEL